MPIEIAPPKYAVIVNTIQERIENGTYPPGWTLPTENDLMVEFNTSRPTVVRSLDILRQGGWIETHQGKGRFVLGAAARASRTGRVHTYGLLDGDEKANIRLLSAGPVLAPPRAAHALNLEPDTAVIARRRLAVVDGVGPVELGTAYLPVALAVDTDVSGKELLSQGLLRHISARKRVVFDHAAERISARLPTPEEADLLQVSRREPLITVLLSVCDRASVPLVALDVLIPASRHELEDVFPLTG